MTKGLVASGRFVEYATLRPWFCAAQTQKRVIAVSGLQKNLRLDPLSKAYDADQS